MAAFKKSIFIDKITAYHYENLSLLTNCGSRFIMAGRYDTRKLSKISGIEWPSWTGLFTDQGFSNSRLSKFSESFTGIAIEL
jgi:hypothetical protein